MSKEIDLNKILTEWNPIGVPKRIAEDEYSEYVADLFNIESDLNSISEYLLNICVNSMGLDPDASAKTEIKEVAKKIVSVLSD